MREAQVEVPCLLAISAFDRIADEYAYANDFKVSLKDFTDLLKTSAWVAQN